MFLISRALAGVRRSGASLTRQSASRTAERSGVRLADATDRASDASFHFSGFQSRTVKGRSQMTIATAARKADTKAAPVPNGDFYQLSDLLTPDEAAIVKKVRAYMEAKVQPIINKYWADDAFPFELLPSFKELQLGGLGY